MNNTDDTSKLGHDTQESESELIADELDVVTGGRMVNFGSQGVIRSAVKDSHDRYA